MAVRREKRGKIVDFEASRPVPLTGVVAIYEHDGFAVFYDCVIDLLTLFPDQVAIQFGDNLHRIEYVIPEHLDERPAILENFACPILR